MDKKQLRKALQQMVMSYEGKYGKNKSLDGYTKVEEDNIVFYYFIDDKKKKITIVIRGSDDFEDWKKNLKYEQIKFKYGKVHKGFWELSDKLFKLVLESLMHRIKKTSEYNLIVIGHSLGGALSQILTLDIYSWLKGSICITAGSPRVFNLKATRYFNKKIKNHYRIVNGSDLITHLPISIIFKFKYPFIFFYKHTKKKIQIGYKGFFGGIIGWFVKSIQEHYPNNYLKNFEKLRDKK